MACQDAGEKGRNRPDHEDACGPLKELPFLNPKSNGKLWKHFKHMREYRLPCSDLCFETLILTVVWC